MDEKKTAERRRQIREMVVRNGYVSIVEVRSKFHITSVTARKDFEDLEKRGLVQRVHGGCVLSQYTMGSNGFQFFACKLEKEKKEIALAASQLISKQDLIFLDASTTAFYLALELIPNHLPALIVTNSMHILDLARQYKYNNLFVLGGEYIPQMHGVVGNTAANILSQIRITQAFVTAKGFDPAYGALHLPGANLDFLQKAVTNFSTIHVLADHSKLQYTSGIHFLPWKRMDHFIINGTPPEYVEIAAKVHGFEILIA